MRQMERKRNAAQYASGYFFVVDADGAEVLETRRFVDTDMDHDHVRAVRRALAQGLGPDCHVEFREA